MTNLPTPPAEAPGPHDYSGHIPRNEAEVRLAEFISPAMAAQVVDAGWRPPHTELYTQRKYDLIQALANMLTSAYAIPLYTPEIRALFDALGIDPSRDMTSLEMHLVLLRRLG